VASTNTNLLNLKEEQQLFILNISGDNDDKELWIIIGASAGGAIVLVVIVVVAWCVHHKRKCRRKGSKGGCSFLVKEFTEVEHGIIESKCSCDKLQKW